jgi:hypothetical protein
MEQVSLAEQKPVDTLREVCARSASSTRHRAAHHGADLHPRVWRSITNSST